MNFYVSSLLKLSDQMIDGKI